MTFMVGRNVHGGGGQVKKERVVQGIGEKDSNSHHEGGQFMVGWTVHGGDGLIMERVDS